MSDFRGYIAFETEELTKEDRARAGAAFFGAGLGNPRVWHDDIAALAHAQRIVTTEDRAERQPIKDPAGRVILFDGYLFEPSPIIGDLGLPPHTPDSQIAAAWLDRYGFETLHKLRGDYSFALWDPREQRLHLIAAPMAMRIVYWHARPKGFWFATTLSALHQFPSVPKTLDPLQLALQFTASVADPADTLYKNIRLVPPGTYLTADARGVRERAFWRLDTRRRVTLRTPQAYAEAARDLLDQAVQRNLRSAQTPGVLLSGGLDSSAVAASAARLLAPAPLYTYTAEPPPGQGVAARDGWYDRERPYVDALAARYPNLYPHFCHSTEPASIEIDPTPFFVAGGRPQSNANHLGWFDPAYRAAQRNGHAMLLTGDCGNFTLSFSGLRGLGDFARGGRLDKLIQLLPGAARFRQRTLWGTLKAHVLLPALPPKLRAALWRWRHPDEEPSTKYAAIRSEFAVRVGLGAALQAQGDDGLSFYTTDSRKLIAHHMEAQRMRTLETIRTVRAYYGFEVRDPFADPDLAEFCLAIPREQYLLGGVQRSLARRALADRLPAALLAERGYGRQNPEWFTRMTAQRESFAAEIERLTNVPLAAEMLDLPRLKQLIDTWPQDASAAEARRFEFAQMLPRAIQTGRFIRWSERGNQ
ncbi:asparagine synthase-related protein [Magnetospirillum molischianum]|uniref:asparagine synthase (glutamine-hydrolyzing) n=1 Tax=Magnetospirillum molischianum DSM 120 TaxID=1150626 RepID=H8FQD4_MAGML|nr:asparagine synthetase B family protein [Magnetospirillum molischianum]CCG40572.1 putative Asparagine synthase [Magnetospirillum molischianum DSM 120]